MSNDRGSTQIALLIALISLVVAVIAIIVDITNPEIRRSLGLDKTQNPGPQVQNPPAVTSTPTYTPTPIPSPPVSVPPSSGPYTDIKSEVGAEPQLQELDQLLKQGDFKAADEKTTKIMLYVANREKEGYIDSDSMQKFSCTDLRTIDQLWLNNSNGRFGFSVQKRIFEENGKDWDKWGDTIGWRRGGKWKSYSELTFQKNAEKGHLPGGDWVSVWSWKKLRGVGLLHSSRCL